MTYFTYNGRSSADFGLHIEKKDVFSAPEYDAEFISIPGRSGDIINPNRRFANIKVTYTVFLARKNVAALASNLRDIKGWLYSEPDRCFKDCYRRRSCRHLETRWSAERRCSCSCGRKPFAQFVHQKIVRR